MFWYFILFQLFLQWIIFTPFNSRIKETIRMTFLKVLLLRDNYRLLHIGMLISNI